jgi:hypothetical protein
MRTNNSTVVTINSVFGYGQDRVVSLVRQSCACAAQHLEPRHAKRDRAWARALKRMWFMAADLFGSDRITTLTCVVITGPRRLRERLLSPKFVLA